MQMTFERLLPRLANAYHQGLLVPFLGAGMSRMACPDWATLIDDLERDAGVGGPSRGEQGQRATADVDRADLIFRANAAIRQLSFGTPRALRQSIRASLYRSSSNAEDIAETLGHARQTDALAKLWWPLVVSSNYDDLFAVSYASQRSMELADTLRRGGAASAEYAPADEAPYEGHLHVLGRSRRDCSRLLSALSVTVPTVLWAIHGYLPRRPIATLESLESEMVVGHDEYRRIAHADPYYRRAFGELWRRRSMLFLGSSLGDPYLLDLFSEVQELYGTNPQPHYALVEDDKRLDEELLRTRFNIIVARYGNYAQLEDRLSELVDVVHAQRPRVTRFAWNYSWDNASAFQGGMPDLEIVHAGLPTSLNDGEGMVLSAGFPYGDMITDRLFFSDGILRVLESVDAELFDAANSGCSIPERNGVFSIASAESGMSRVGAVRPWKSASSRDLNLIPGVLAAAFDWAVQNRISHVHMPVIGAGASRHFPASVALSMMVRAHKRWRDAHAAPLRLTIHVVEATALFELTSGRLDVMELLTSSDLRFWVEFENRIDGNANEERLLHEPAIVDETTTLAEFSKTLGLPTPAEWELRAEPAPERDGAWLPANGETTIGAIGMSAGATLKVRRRAAK